MTKKDKTTYNWLQINTLRTARVHFYYIAAFIVYTMIFDGWKVITPQAVLQRWTVAASLLVVTTLVWYGSRAQSKNDSYYKVLVYILILADILFAAFMIYAERGMASRGVALFAIPILVSAILNSPSALFATASLSVAAYTFAAVRYFVVNFNEGYRIELYAVLFFYSLCFFVLAGILSVIVRSRSSSS